MSTNTKHSGRTSTGAATGAGKSYFEQQREVLVQDIAANLEQVLQNMNKLNRSLESVIAVGNEFGQVEGLWSMFENVMKQREGQEEEENTQAQSGQGQQGHGAE